MKRTLVGILLAATAACSQPSDEQHTRAVATARVDSAYAADTARADTSSAPSVAACANSPAYWSHIYHRDRLEILEQCATVTGYVELIRHEPDGDTHMLLRPDTAFVHMLSEANYTRQRSDLVIEIVCAYDVKQEDAKEACAAYSNPITVPHKGDYISVTGAYVKDLDHSGWNEIHPVFDLRVLQAAEKETTHRRGTPLRK